MKRAPTSFVLALCLIATGFQVAAAQEDKAEFGLCHIFEEKVAEVNAAGAKTRPEGFTSVLANVDCAEKAYSLYGVLTELAAASIGQVADQIKSSYRSATCQDRKTWDLAFDEGWTTSFYFSAPSGETALSMTLSSCEQ